MYEIFTPKSKILQKYIQSFSVMKEFDGAINYLAFPQLGISMALFIHAKIAIEENGVAIDNINKINPQVLLLGKYTLPIQLKYHGFTPEISINFTPTGLNYFFKENTGTIANKKAQFVDLEIWKEFVSLLYKQDTNSDKIDMLENFLLANLLEKDITTVESCISLMNENPDYSITNIAAELQVSTKTINRQFANFIGCSPMEFKKIIRFRNAIHTKFKEPFKNLTQICFDSNFYDSPHFTREFKKLTKMNPSDFFADIKTVVDKDIPYKFL